MDATSYPIPSSFSARRFGTLHLSRVRSRLSVILCLPFRIRFRRCGRRQATLPQFADQWSSVAPTKADHFPQTQATEVLEANE